MMMIVSSRLVKSKQCAEERQDHCGDDFSYTNYTTVLLSNYILIIIVDLCWQSPFVTVAVIGVVRF
jgi:hypothetical protein